MRAVSDQFLAALRGSGKAVFRLTNDGAFPYDIIDGTVTLDGSADVRGSLDVVINAPWSDTAPDNTLTIYGDTLEPSVGLEFGNGNTEWVPLGVFRINTIDQDDVYADALRITAQDSACRYTDYRAQFVNTIGASETLHFLVDLVGGVWSGFSYESDQDLTLLTVGRQVVFGGPDNTAWGVLKDIATSRGKILYFDHNDVLQIVDPPDPGSPVFTVDTGRNGVLVAASRSQTREGVYNVVIATGESPDNAAPPSGYARDENPDSPTYYQGPFGQVQRWYFSPLLLTGAQCTAAATTILRRSLGVPYEISLTTVPNPALEPHDPVLVRFTEGEQELHIIDTVKIPLVPERPTELTTRQIPYESEA